MTGQINPLPGEPDILWRTVTSNPPMLVAVEAVHGSTTGDGYLNVWDGEDHKIVHRAKIKVQTSALMGVHPDSIREWEEEVIKVIKHPEYRRVEA